MNPRITLGVLIVVLTGFFSPAMTVEPAAGEFKLRTAWLKANLATEGPAIPVSFVYGERLSRDRRSDWPAMSHLRNLIVGSLERDRCSQSGA